MKVAQFGLLFGALTMATAKASLLDEFDEDTDLAELDDFLMEEEGRMLQFADEDAENEELDDDENDRRINRKQWLRKKANKQQKKWQNKGKKMGKRMMRQKRKARWSKDGEEFDYDNFLEMLGEKEDDMEERVEAKCAKRIKKMDKVYDFMSQVEDGRYDDFLVPEDIEARTEAWGNRCEAMSTCKWTAKLEKMKCEGMFKAVKKSMNPVEDGEEPFDAKGLTAADVGKCYENLLSNSDLVSCKAEAETAFDEDMDGVAEIDPELMKEIKKEMRAAKKEARKAKRQERKKNRQNRNKNGRKNRRGRKNNRRQRRDNQYDDEDQSEME